METKKTAVEWLKSELQRQYMFDAFAWEDRAYFMKLLKQAKAMEKEQIKDAHLIGLISSMEMEATKQAEQYYNETYNVKDN